MPETALITGASRGIGRAMCAAFARAGYRVAIQYNQSAQAAQALAAELTACGAQAAAFAADVADSAQVDRLLSAVTAQLGAPSVLVCNAGIAQQALFTDISDADWRRMLDVNLTGAFNCCRAALPAMIARKQGRIVTVSSVWGVLGASCEVHYSAAKAGLIGLTKALAREVGPSGITVNCIAPGVIATDMLSAFTPGDLQALAEATPLGRLGAPEDVAGLAVFLASPAAGFITGQVIGVDGGFPT